MHPINISLVSLGSLKYPVDIAYLEGWKSQLVTIKHGASIGHLPNAEGLNWQYTNDQLNGLIKEDDDASFTLALINAPLEDNYYMRRLSNKVAVLSLFEMAEIVRFSDFTIENFILRNIYELVVLYAANGALIPTDAHTWAHDDVRGCLFDMNANKSDIVFSMHQPTLCNACRARVLSKQVNSGFLPQLEDDLSKIKKALYFRMAEWVKTHPLYALTITAIFAITLNLIASIIFEKAKSLLPWLG
jgi:hypothetical protein